MRNLSTEIKKKNRVIEKAKNGKSSILEAVRERLSPAESSLKRKICEVHPGADFAKAYVSSEIRVTHVIRYE